MPAGWKHFDLERRADHAVISRDPDAFFRVNPRQVALDEVRQRGIHLDAEIPLVAWGLREFASPRPDAS